MTKMYSSDSPAEIYRQQLSDLLAEGRQVRVNNEVASDQDTLELLNVVTELTRPRNRMQVVPGRYANPWLALSEALHLLAGREDVATLKPYNRRITDYSDDGSTLYASYGHRLRDQIEPALARLEANPTDRRVVLSIWRAEDLTVRSKNSPCNDVIMFKLRDEKLHMTVTCRSNDLHWGLHAVNLPQFSILQEYLAARLRVSLGSQVHISNSLHLYKDGPHAAINERMLAAMDEPLPQTYGGWLFPTMPISHADFVRDCNRALENMTGPTLTSPVPLLEFAADFLALYRNLLARGGNVPLDDQEVRHASTFADWMEAGSAFLQRPR